jgi:hypothetical protein
MLAKLIYVSANTRMLAFQKVFNSLSKLRVYDVMG